MQQLMDLFHKIYDVQGIVQIGGLALIAAIIFAETGLMVGFFLPGDSLLVTAGIYCTSANPKAEPIFSIITLNLVVIVAAIVGDTLGYWIGAKAGPKIFTREKSLFFSRKHLLRTQEFYERHGGKTIIIARFIPIIRTFAPVVAGVGKMSYKRFISYNVFGGIGWSLSMTLLGFALAQIRPRSRKDRQGHHRHHRGLADADRHQLPAQPPQEGAARHHARHVTMVNAKAKAKATAPEKPRAAPKVAFPKKGQPPTHTEFAARLPAPVGKRFEVLRAYLKKQGAAEDFFYYGPRSGWAYRYMKEDQSLCSILLSAGRLVGIVALDGAAQAAIAWNDLTEVARRARKLAHGTPALLWLDVPLDSTGATDFKALLKAKLARVG